MLEFERNELRYISDMRSNEYSFELVCPCCKRSTYLGDAALRVAKVPA